MLVNDNLIARLTRGGFCYKFLFKINTKTNSQGETSMLTVAARLTNVPTRLGAINLLAYPVIGSPILISAEDKVVKVGRRVLHIPVGAVLIPRRYGPKKRKIVMQVYKNIFDALRSRHGVSAYYGRPGHGAVYHALTIATRLRAEAASCPDQDAAGRLEELARQFEDGAYSKSRLISRLEVWHNALLLALADDLQLLRQMRTAIEAFSDGQTLDPIILRAQADGLRLAPFVGTHGVVNELVGRRTEGLVFSESTHESIVDELISEIDGYLLRAEFEQAHCEAKTIERGMVDDAGRRLNPTDGSFYGRFIVGLLPSLEAIGTRMPEHQREATASVVEAMRSVYRALNTVGLMRESLSLFLRARGLMKALSDALA